MSVKKIYITPNTFQRDCARLARKVFDDAWQPELILALWRGGAVPGIVISESFTYLGHAVKHAIIKCTSYAGIGQRGNQVVFQGAEETLAAIKPGQKVLVVDDVFDSGKSAEAVKLRLPHADLRIATVYYKPDNNLVGFTPDYWIRETAEWLVFPHEMDGLTEDELRIKDPELADILLG